MTFHGGEATVDTTFEPDTWASEQVLLCRDEEADLHAVIVIDSTALGPGLGGVRFRSYETDAHGIRECRRLAAGMTLKNALAGVPYGGAKSIIFGRPTIRDRDALMRRFGDFVARTGGTYIPGVDMSTTTDDLLLIGQSGADVSCSETDPSPFTATGVAAAIRAAVEHTDQRTGIDGVRVLIQGAGHVGARLAGLLRDGGAEVIISDVDTERAEALAEKLGGATVGPDEAMRFECDVFAPCAVAGVVSAHTAPLFQCRIIAGAANDTLAGEGCADLLAQRRIVYVPDFLANAGGVIQIHAERAQHSDEQMNRDILAIGARVSELLVEASALGLTPLAVAERRADEIVNGALAATRV